MKNNESESRIMSKINTLIQDVNKKTKINKNDTINISEDEDLVESENLKINLHSSGGSYKSMFSIISKDDEKEDENESAEYINKNNYKLDKSNNSNDLRRDSCISQISNISSGFR